MAASRKRVIARNAKPHSKVSTGMAIKKNSVCTRKSKKSEYPGKVAEPSKSLNSKQDTLPDVASRLFSIPKKSRILFVSSSMAQEDGPAVVSSVVEKAKKENCSVVIHAGWSFEIKREEDGKTLLDWISKAVRKTSITKYICEIYSYNYRKKADKTRNFYIIEQSRDGISTTKCLEQRILTSHDASEPFVTAMETVKKRDVAAQNEYPCLLLVCGENNVFNKGNRGSANRIESGSLSDRMMIALKKIQNRKWCIVNPSHKPYKGVIGNCIMAFHKACSQDQRIKCDFAVNNPPHRAGKHPFHANIPTCWRSGKPISGQIICDENGLHMYRFDL